MFANKRASPSKSECTNISFPLKNNLLHRPNAPIPPHIDFIYYNPDKGHAVTMIQLIMNVPHSTHIDAPRHFFPNGTSFDEILLDTAMGPARIIDIKDTESIKAKGA